MSLRGLCAGFLALGAACGGGSPSRPSARRSDSAAGPQPQAVAVAVRADSTPRPAPRRSSDRVPPAGAAYQRAIATSMLAETREGRPLHPKASDETDLSNYQSAGWRIGVASDDLGRVPVRFFAGFDRFTSGMAIITLDTTLRRNQVAPPFDSRMADSIAIAGLGRTERVATTCRFGAYDVDERLVGIVRDTTREQWVSARLAWLLDTAAVRIRPIRPDSISCKLAERPD